MRRLRALDLLVATCVGTISGFYIFKPVMEERQLERQTLAAARAASQVDADGRPVKPRVWTDKEDDGEADSGAKR